MSTNTLTMRSSTSTRTYTTTGTTTTFTIRCPVASIVTGTGTNHGSMNIRTCRMPITCIVIDVVGGCGRSAPGGSRFVERGTDPLGKLQRISRLSSEPLALRWMPDQRARFDGRRAFNWRSSAATWARSQLRKISILGSLAVAFGQTIQ